MCVCVCVCVWAHLFYARQKQDRMLRDGKREEIEIDPGKMADRKERKKGENTRLKERREERERVMVAAVCVSALTML